MRAYTSGTELQLNSSLPRPAWLCIGATGIVASLYALRTILGDITPSDHIAVSLLLCILLITLLNLVDEIQITISLSHDRCWLQHYHLGSMTQQSFPLSQIHSAKLEHHPDSLPGQQQETRIVLVTSLGMIPVGERYTQNRPSVHAACNTINRFLASQSDYLNA